MKRIVILGGSGTHGSVITEQLAQSNVQVAIAGHDTVKGQACADSLQADFVRCWSPVTMAGGNLHNAGSYFIPEMASFRISYQKRNGPVITNFISIS